MCLRLLQGGPPTAEGGILHALSVCAPLNEAFVCTDLSIQWLVLSLYCNRTSSTCCQCARRISAGLGISFLAR